MIQRDVKNKIKREVLKPIQSKNKKIIPKSYTFGNPKGFEQNRTPKTFDSHLLGDTSVEYLVKKSLQRKLPNDISKLNSTFDPNNIGNAFVKGGIMSLKSKEKVNSITQQCEFLPPPPAQ